jgi:SpoVK/Ycf46/Vps4 family AAA+-type ATPase
MKRKNNKISATNVNNYNKFLLHLDTNKKSSTESIKVNTNPNETEINNTMKEIIKNLSSLFDQYKYDTPAFHGIRSEDDNMEINDPNDPVVDTNLIRKPRTVYVKKTFEPIVTGEKNKTEISKEKKHVNIIMEVKNIDDLLKIIEKYTMDENTTYNINLKALHNIKDSLIELNNMIGMNSLKNNVVDQILYFIQDLHKTNNHSTSGDFMHTVLYGPPGTGKTEIAKIMGKIYCKLGILKNGRFKKVTRSDLVAGYLGQTALKTRDVIKDCLGGVIFIDEAYALGNNEKRDSFSKECIDTLCEALSDHKHELMVIIAGYEHELNECFFNYNQGLDSRFIWRFKTDEYKADELYQIFVKKIKESDWSIDEEPQIHIEWFQRNMDSFPFFGRDMESLLSKIKISHSRRVFCKPEKEKKKITLEDLEKGFDIYLKNDTVQNRKNKEETKKIMMNMYI